MEDPLDMGDSLLFNDQGSSVTEDVQTDDMDLAGSLLFAAPEPIDVANDASDDASNDVSPSDYGPLFPLPSKTVKLFDGSTLSLKPRVRTQYPEISNDMSIMDMDGLFQKVKEKQTLKENQTALNAINNKPKKNKPTSVWTEKYRPKRFVQLCSAGNDRLYRSVSHWLKKWSSVVFDELVEDDGNVDKLGRPLKKFLLINGPPGIGKTAAAHVIAKQLGYSIEELNAANSMDTLPNASSTGPNNYGNVVSALRLKIHNALTSTSIQKQNNKLVTDGKPTCLIIDEIDTAGNSSDIIRVLNEIYQSDQRALNKTGNNDGKKKKDKLLTRPIICIANDIYSTGARTYGGFNMDKLRSMSEIVTFRKPAFQKATTGIKTGGKALRTVKDYIKWISDLEKLKLDYQEISELVEICEGDIRACVNYLQFNGRRVETLGSAVSSGTSNKDAQLSWFRLADMLFKRDPQLSKDDDFNNLLDIVLNGAGKSASSSSGTLDKVIRACFNRYLDAVHYQDDSLAKPCELSEWLHFYDSLGNKNEVSHYTALTGMKFWQLCSEISPNKHSKSLIPDIKSIEFESSELQKANKAIMKRFIANTSLSLKVSLGGGFEDNESFPIFVMPMIHKLISPDMASSGSTNSLSMKLKSALHEFDQRSLEKVAYITKSFGIELETSRNIDTNQITLELNPGIDSLVLYDSEFAPVTLDTNSKRLQSKRRWLFPMLGAELGRSELLEKAEKRKAETPFTAVTKEEKPKKKQRVASSVDFFKGQYDGLSTQIKQTKDKVDTENTRIWIKYNEGYSNAVRKNIGWDDFWAL